MFNMKLKSLFIFILVVVILAIICTLPGSYSLPEKPPQDNVNSKTVSYQGVTTIKEDKTYEEKTFESEEALKNAVLIESGSVHFNSCTFNKSGNGSSESEDFYGNNAALLVYSKGIANINGGKIKTSGEYANALFAYGTGVINVSNSKIITEKRNSGGIMVAGGGSIVATDLEVETSGNSSASIRSDRGGGSIKVNSGKYTTNGVGSPVIYSTADIEVRNATLEANKSEGVVVEGKNSVVLDTCTLNDNNTTLNGNSTTYKNIFLYQSMSGDASVGESSFEARNSNITTKKGDSLYVTNTKAVITLENNKIINLDGDFLRIEAAKWGSSGSNGGDVTLDLKKQEVEGNIIVDDISTLKMNLKEESNYTGIINKDNSAKQISLTLSKNSKITLEGDSYITSLDNEDESNANIDLNGYKLYVAGKEIQVQKVKQEVGQVEEESAKEETKELIKYIIIGITIVFLIVIIIYMVIKKTKKDI